MRETAKFTFRRTIMTKGIGYCKRVSKVRGSKDDKLWLFTMGKRNIFLFSRSEVKGVMYFHHLYAVEDIDEDISFTVHLEDFEKMFKGKGKEKEITLELIQEDGIDYVNLDDRKTEIDKNDLKSPIKQQPYVNVDVEEVYNKLGVISSSIEKSSDTVDVGGQDISVRSPFYLKRIIFDKELRKLTFDADNIKLLYSCIYWRKSDDKTMDMHNNRDKMYVRFSGVAKERENSFRQLFVLDKYPTEAPNLNNTDGETVHTFKIDADEFKDAVSMYKAVIGDLYLYDHNGKLRVSPFDSIVGTLNDEELELVQDVNYEGNLKRTKVSLGPLKSFLEGHTGIVDVDVVEFKEEDEIFHYLRVYGVTIYSMVLLKKEPNYVKVQKVLDAIIEKQKEIEYI